MNIKMDICYLLFKARDSIVIKISDVFISDYSRVKPGRIKGCYLKNLKGSEIFGIREP